MLTAASVHTASAASVTFTSNRIENLSPVVRCNIGQQAGQGTVTVSPVILSYPGQPVAYRVLIEQVAMRNGQLVRTASSTSQWYNDRTPRSFHVPRAEGSGAYSQYLVRTQAAWKMSNGSWFIGAAYASGGLWYQAAGGTSFWKAPSTYQQYVYGQQYNPYFIGCFA